VKPERKSDGLAELWVGDVFEEAIAARDLLD
jgi:hypothetical protein